MFLLVNLQFTAWPEMLSYPYLRNHGYLLYKDIIHPYPPVLTMALSILYKIFGYKLTVLKLATWLIILANDILIFLIAKKLTKKNIFAFSSLIFYILTQPFLEGNQLWFDLAIVPPILLGVLFLLQPSHKQSLSQGLKASAAAAGVAFAVASLTKQTTGIFLAFTLLYLIIQRTSIRNLILFLAGPIILWLVFLARLITEGALPGFINWVFVYPLTSWSKFPGYVQMAITNRQLVILVLLVIPIIPILVNRKFILPTSYFILSLILLYPRFSFFHFQLGIAFVAILFSLVFKEKKSFCWLAACSYCLLLLLVLPLALRTDWRGETRFWGKEDVKLAEIIKKETKPDDKIFLLGPHSGLYVLANRLPPKIWSDNFGWYLEIPGVQEKIIARWQENPPTAVFTSELQSGNWYDLGTYRPQKIVDWLGKEKLKKIEL